MKRQLTLIGIAAVVIFGGLYYLHKSRLPALNPNNEEQPQLYVTQAGMQAWFYAQGAGDWWPGQNITIPDPNPSQGVDNYTVTTG